MKTSTASTFFHKNESSFFIDKRNTLVFFQCMRFLYIYIGNCPQPVTVPKKKGGSRKPLLNQKVNPLRLLQGGGSTQIIFYIYIYMFYIYCICGFHNPC